VEDYKALMSLFPTGVSVVTTVDDGGEPHGITCSSLISVTVRPPTLLVSIRRGSPTLTALRVSGAFAVNLLHARATPTAQLFATPVRDRFGKVAWRPAPRTGVPWLHTDAVALADCRLVRTISIGDHVLTVGQVIATVWATEAPLLYGLRRYSAWPEPTDDNQITEGNHHGR
jgi:flavin reductase (DIM6/NTAB) family NADH-FMN oxidoreductase RutF